MPENSKNVNNYSVAISEISSLNRKFRIQAKNEVQSRQSTYPTQPF